MTLSYPYQFWSYTNQTVYSYKRYTKDNYILMEIELPGVEKASVELEYETATNHILLKIDDKNIGSMEPLRLIDPEKIEAELELGILKIKAPVKHSNKAIQIK